MAVPYAAAMGTPLRKQGRAADLPVESWMLPRAVQSTTDLGAPSMQSQERDRIATFLDAAVSAGLSSDEVAALVATTFQGIDQALAPIVGRRGMAALYQRSLHLCRPVHPWLPFAAAGGVESEIDLAALTLALAARTSADAAGAGTRLLESLRALLTTLIGELLTERLLRPVWANLLSGAPAPEPKS